MLNRLVSVIVPCYNQGAYLADTLNSILKQSYAHWECIIVNDGSTDDTEKIALQYQAEDKRFRYFYQRNDGLSSARNTGISNAAGDYIQLLDSDDLIENRKLELFTDLYHTGKVASNVIIYSSMRYFENGKPGSLKITGRQYFVAHSEVKQTDSPESQLELVKARNPFVISAPLYPKSIFEAVGYFDEGLTALEDWDFHIRCVAHGLLFHHHYEPDTYTLIRLHDDSMMRNQKLLDDNFWKLISRYNLRPATAPEPPSKARQLIKGVTPPYALVIWRRLIKALALNKSKTNS